MDNKNNHLLKKVLIWFAAMVVLLAPALSGYAESRKETAAEAGISSWSPYASYPKSFSSQGVLDSMTRTSIVISDTRYALDERVTFHIPRQDKVSVSFFNIGDKVGLIQNPQGQIISIWKIENFKDFAPK